VHPPSPERPTIPHSRAIAAHQRAPARSRQWFRAPENGLVRRARWRRGPEFASRARGGASLNSLLDSIFKNQGFFTEARGRSSRRRVGH
jgi:hypothetical protein